MTSLTLKRFAPGVVVIAIIIGCGSVVQQIAQNNGGNGDGRNDIVGTLDRRTGSGLSDDRLVWYRNVRTDPDEAASRPTSDKPQRPR